MRQQKSCFFGFFGLSGLFSLSDFFGSSGCLDQPNQLNKQNEPDEPNQPSLLRRAGMMRLQVEGDIFANLLNGPTDEHFAWNFHAREQGRIYSSLNRIVFIDIQAYRPVWKTNRVERIIVSH